METTQQLIDKCEPTLMLRAILGQLPQEQQDALVHQAARNLGYRFESDKLPMDRFWEIVDMINWGKDHKTIKIDQVKLRLMRTLTLEELDGVSERNQECQCELARALKQWERKTSKELDIYGDSYDDLLSHIVGCGKEEFEASVKDPSRVFERIQRRDYWESFSYCIPWREDYKKLTLKYYQKWARRVHDEWEERTCDTIEGLKASSGETPKDAVLAWLRLVAICPDVGSLRAAVELYEKRDFLRLVRSLDIKREHREFGRSTVNEWAVRNLVSDAQKFLFAGDADSTDNEEGRSPR